MKTVRIFDLKTKTLTEIPASELAEGYVRANVEGVDGEVFINRADLSPNNEQHDYDFTEVMPLLRDLHERLVEVYPVSWERWVDGFRADQNPEREIALWSFMADQYENAIDGRFVSPDQRKECFRVILSAVNNGPDKALEVVTLNHITKEEAKEIIASLPR